jgi:hypothetical protein
MREPRSYVVRVYRQGYRSLCGVVEDTRTGQTHPFRDVRQLTTLLRGERGAGAPATHEADVRSTHGSEEP